MTALQSKTGIACLVFTSLIGNVIAQVPSEQQTISNPGSQASPTSPAAVDPSSESSSGNGGLISSLWAGGESLLSSLYPSTSVGNIATLTWPTSVVIGSSTVSVPHSSASNPSSKSPTASNTATSSDSASSSSASPKTTASSKGATSSGIATSLSNSQTSSNAVTSSPNTAHAIEPTQTPSDTQPVPVKKSDDHKEIIGIVLGVVFGLLVVAVAICAFLLYRRRRRRQRILRQYESPAGESEIQSWRQPSNNIQVSQAPDRYTMLAPPPMSRYQPSTPYQPLSNPYQNDQAIRHLEGAAPYAAPYESAVPEPNPFYTAEERQSLRSNRPFSNDHAHLSHEFADPNRPPTPFMSALFQNPARKPLPPRKSPNRASYNAVHYPTNSETSDFNFGFTQSKADDFGDLGDVANHSASGEGWDQRAVHPAYRT
ncbi:MAG: hypothetical protein Q9165_005622 [Trypethelium subeluteriae]